MLSLRGVALLIESEGLRLHEYLDSAGYPTIGIGHLLKPEERKRQAVWLGGQWVPYANGLTKDQCMSLMQQDAGWATSEIARLVKVMLTQNQADSLIAFTFNVGSANLASSTLLKKLNQGYYMEVPTQMLRWVFAGGKRSNGLLARRQREAALWSS